MPDSGLYGSYPLTAEKIDEVVKGAGAGVYALGYRKKESFYFQYVGRSDSDLNGRLLDYVDGKYERFKYGFYTSVEDAYKKECLLYHNFNPKDNSIHPDKPDGTNYICPVCNP